MSHDHSGKPFAYGRCVRAAVAALALAGCFGTEAPSGPGKPGGWLAGDTALAAYRLFDVHFPDADTGYAVGDGILRTVNGGKSWTPLDAGASGLNAVHFLSGRVGWTAGSQGLVYRTTDAGDTWSVADGMMTEHARGVHFTSALTGFCAGDWGAISRTTDGGATWERRAWSGDADAEEVYAVHFPVPDTGYAVGAKGLLLRTVDGGETWALQDGGTGQDLHGVQFLTSKAGYAVGAGGGSGSVHKTVDAGETWLDVSGASAGSQGHLALHFVDANTGWVAGDFGVIYRTSDGGSTWTRQASARENTLRAIHFTDEKRGWAVEMYWGLIETWNGGE